MTAKKKFNFKAPLEVFAKSIVQPMMYLSVAGILLIVGIILTNKTICAVVPVLGLRSVPACGRRCLSVADVYHQQPLDSVLRGHRRRHGKEETRAMLR